LRAAWCVTGSWRISSLFFTCLPLTSTLPLALPLPLAATQLNRLRFGMRIWLKPGYHFLRYVLLNKTLNITQHLMLINAH
jgi:hypothetical protein